MQKTLANCILVKHINCFVAQDSKIPYQNKQYWKKTLQLFAQTGYLEIEYKAHRSIGVNIYNAINPIK